MWWERLRGRETDLGLDKDVEWGGRGLLADVGGAQRTGKVQEGVGVSHGVVVEAGWRAGEEEADGGAGGGGRGCRGISFGRYAGVGARTDGVWIFGANSQIKRLDNYGRLHRSLPQLLFFMLPRFTLKLDTLKQWHPSVVEEASEAAVPVAAPVAVLVAVAEAEEAEEAEEAHALPAMPLPNPESRTPRAIPTPRTWTTSPCNPI